LKNKKIRKEKAQEVREEGGETRGFSPAGRSENSGNPLIHRKKM
jgi:hypothetical protein